MRKTISLDLRERSLAAYQTVEKSRYHSDEIRLIGTVSGYKNACSPKKKKQRSRSSG